MNDALVANREVTRELATIENAVNDFERVDEATERLVAIVENIEKYGISRPMMEAVDPKGELIAAGICGSYEELGVLQERGDAANGVIEGIYGAIMAKIPYGGSQHHRQSSRAQTDSDYAEFEKMNRRSSLAKKKAEVDNELHDLSENSRKTITDVLAGKYARPKVEINTPELKEGLTKANDKLKEDLSKTKSDSNERLDKHKAKIEENHDKAIDEIGKETAKISEEREKLGKIDVIEITDKVKSFHAEEMEKRRLKKLETEDALDDLKARHEDVTDKRQKTLDEMDKIADDAKVGADNIRSSINDEHNIYFNDLNSGGDAESKLKSDFAKGFIDQDTFDAMRERIVDEKISKMSPDELKEHAAKLEADHLKDVGKRDGMHIGVKIGIGIAILALIVGFVHFLMYIVPKLRKLSNVVKRSTIANEEELKHVEHKLSEVHSFDEEKFRSSVITTYTKEAFQKALAINGKIVSSINGGTLQKLIDELATLLHDGKITKAQIEAIDEKANSFAKTIGMDPDTKAILGVTCTITDGKLKTYAKHTPSVLPTKEHAGRHNWHVSDAHHALSSALGITHQYDHMTVHIESASNLCTKLGEWMKTHFKADTETSAEEKEAIKSAIVSIRGMIELSHELMIRSIATNNHICESALHLANAAVAAKKHH